MKKSRWNDYEVIKLIQNLPEIEDKRTKEQVYRRLDSRKRRNRLKRNRIPFISAVCALILLAVLGASVMGNQKEEMDFVQESVSEDKNMAAETRADSTAEDSADQTSPQSTDEPAESEDISSEKKAEDSSLNDAQESKAQAAGQDEGEKLTAGDYEPAYVTIGVPDAQGNYIIPVTFPAAEGLSLAGVLNDAAGRLQEEKYGIQDNYPLEGVFRDGEQAGELIVDLPEDSALLKMDELFLAALEETMKYNGIAKVQFRTDGVPGTDFSHAGRLTEVQPERAANRAYFIYQYPNGKDKFLAPSNHSYSGAEEALQALKEGEEGEGIHPSIPETVSWDGIEAQGKTLAIHLTDSTMMDDSEDCYLAVQAVLLTAKDFGFQQVRFENAPADAVREFDLTMPLEVPEAPNPLN